MSAYCINYHCNFLNSERSLFVFSEKVKDEEVERLKNIGNPITSIEQQKEV